jgi:hypothetical protein
MLNRLKFVALATALALGAMGTAAYAQSSQGTSPESGAPGKSTMYGDGMMQGGDMMKMMTQMNQMMETCNKMMQSAMQSPTDPERPSAPSQQNGG